MNDPLHLSAAESRIVLQTLALLVREAVAAVDELERAAGPDARRRAVDRVLVADAAGALLVTYRNRMPEVAARAAVDSMARVHVGAMHHPAMLAALAERAGPS
jgi:hypothetical protein